MSDEIYTSIVDKLLWPLWRGVGEDYKERYLKNIWDQFENNIRSAAYTNRLPIFLSKIKNLMNIEIQAQYNKDIAEIISSGLDEQILTLLRDETSYLAVLTRLKNQERKETLTL